MLTENTKIFPCRECDSPNGKRKAPYTSNGFKDASNDTETIREWQIRWPDALIGLPTGAVNGVFVIDLDLDAAKGKDGLHEWELLAAGHEPIETFTVKTPRGGRHIYFNHRDGLKNSTDKIAVGIDTRGEGGYVIYPSPGSGYEIEVDAPLVDVPEWIISMLNPPRQAPTPRPVVNFPTTNTGEDVQAALRYIHPDTDHDSWLKIGMALQSEPSVDGLGLWDSWSSGGQKYCPGDCAKRWRSFKAGGITIASLFDMAKAGGYRPERRAAPVQSHGVQAVAVSKPTDADFIKRVQQALFDSEIGDARLFADLARGQKIFNHTDQVWMDYSGGAWAPDEISDTIITLSEKLLKAYGQLYKKIADEKKSVVAEMAGCDEAAGSKELKDKLEKLGKTEKNITSRMFDLKSKTYLGRVESLARSLMPVTAKDFEKNKNLLCLENGTFDFKTLTLRPHSPDDGLLFQSPVKFDLAATCPKWDEFLRKIFINDQELIDWIACQCGIALTGHIEEALLFCYGAGANGKSTLFGPLQMILGPYYLTLPIENLLMSKDAGSSTEAYHKATLANKRLVVAPEMPEGRRLSESLIKDLTGGITDKVTGRNPYGRPFEFFPSHKLMLFGNHKPIIRGRDDGIWRRVRLVPFNYKFTGAEKRDKTEVMAEFRAELPGIFNWCLKGYASRPPTPQAVLVASEEFKRESDLLSEFIAETIEVDNRSSVAVKVLFAAYVIHCEKSREFPIAKRPQDLARMLRERGFEVQPGADRCARLFGAKSKLETSLNL